MPLHQLSPAETLARTSNAVETVSRPADVETAGKSLRGPNYNYYVCQVSQRSTVLSATLQCFMSPEGACQHCSMLLLASPFPCRNVQERLFQMDQDGIAPLQTEKPKGPPFSAPVPRFPAS